MLKSPRMYKSDGTSHIESNSSQNLLNQSTRDSGLYILQTLLHMEPEKISTQQYSMSFPGDKFTKTCFDPSRLDTYIATPPPFRFLSRLYTPKPGSEIELSSIVLSRCVSWMNNTSCSELISLARKSSFDRKLRILWENKPSEWLLWLDRFSELAQW